MKRDQTLLADRLPSPLGDLFAVVDQRGVLVLLDFVSARERANDERELAQRFARAGKELEWSTKPLRHVEEELRRYFHGRLREFTLPVAPPGTAFQMEVWKHLRRIPYGTTVSYGELARRIGRVGAARAVGRANATNPVAIVVPCHRVVGAAGALTGYAGGMERKRALLELEGAA